MGKQSHFVFKNNLNSVLNDHSSNDKKPQEVIEVEIEENLKEQEEEQTEKVVELKQKVKRGRPSGSSTSLPSIRSLLSLPFV